TPFEAHVLSLLDGQRSVEQVRSLSALSLEDLRIALCMLGDKGLVQVMLERPETTQPSAPPFAMLQVLGDLSLSASGPEQEPVVMDAEALELVSLERATELPPAPVSPPAAVRSQASLADKRKAASV